jgi:hypothetical protein
MFNFQNCVVKIITHIVLMHACYIYLGIQSYEDDQWKYLISLFPLCLNVYANNSDIALLTFLFYKHTPYPELYVEYRNQNIVYTYVL